MERHDSKTLATTIGIVLLASGCGSGGGVREGPAVQSPPPPPRPAPSFNPCPSPVTADCLVQLEHPRQEDLPATDSRHALALRGSGELSLREQRYRFGGGTRVEGGLLRVGGGQVQTTLESDVHVLPGAQLFVAGRIQGRLDNAGQTRLWGTVSGDVVNRADLELGELVDGNLVNRGRLAVSSAVYGNALRVTGDFTQAADGTFVYRFAPSGWDSPRPLQVDGRATLAGGVELGLYSDDWGPYTLPDAGAHHMIHAVGGVSGRFSGWTSPGFAISGSLRYGANDVWFDLSRISLAAAAAASGVDSALARHSAANVDLALAGADAFAAGAAAPDEAGRRFLRSAAAVLWQRDPAQAMRSLASLAGHAHAALPSAMHGDAVDGALATTARLATLSPAGATVAWSAPSPVRADGRLSAQPSSGIDAWLSPRLLLGGSVGGGPVLLQVDGAHGWGEGQAQRASVHLHYRGDGWRATGVAGAGRTRLSLQRLVDLGAAGRHALHSRRGVAQGFAHGALERELRLGGGLFAPFVALDYSRARADAFVEQGTTGFELVAGSAMQDRLTGTLGARYGRQWIVDGRPLRLELVARYRHGLFDADPVRAAFRGVPEVRFDVPGGRDDRGADFGLGLDGAFGAHARWSLQYAGAPGGGQRGHRWTLAVLRPL